MGKFLAIFTGLIAMVGGVLLVIFLWGSQVRDLFFALIPILLFSGGLIALIAGINRFRDDARIEKLEPESEEEADSILPEPGQDVS